LDGDKSISPTRGSNNGIHRAVRDEFASGDAEMRTRQGWYPYCSFWRTVIKENLMYSAVGTRQSHIKSFISGVWNSCRRFGLGLLITAPALVSASDTLPGLTYSNARDAEVPLSIHVVKLDRANPLYQIESIHAQGGAIGLDTLSDQLGRVNPAIGVAVAAINGDYYERERAYAGAPRGLQVMDGELLSGPSGGASFWVDATGDLHAETVESRFQITWPDGKSIEFGLNGERRDDGVELYTKAVGSSTHTTGGRELIVTHSGVGPWLPLHIGRTYTARVREIREAGDTPLDSNIVVVSIGPAVLLQHAPQLRIGDTLEISTASEPALHGIKTAIGGGPMLVRNGRRERVKEVPESQSYQVTTMIEEHPRAAIGWNEKYLFFVEVDGRQKHLSIGMTLDDLAKYLVKLGCQEAMNFDGGGSATLWFDGQVRNSPCDRMEREIANGLVIVRKKR
jgi:nitrogen fixation protein